jgi:aldehyde:ferredoxin oxidoreductase
MQPILKINLSTGICESFEVPKALVQDYIGGASLGARILYEYLTKDLDPFSPEAPLLFLGGPLTGTLGPAVGRFVVCGKSPATGLWGESNCGGFWGPELRFAGYDGLWITGNSDTASFISIIDGKVTIQAADHLWGLDTYEIQRRIKEEINQPKAKVLAIGPAGENKVLYSGLFCDHGRTAGRTGLGAVMGSKKLKAIAVRGAEKIPLAQPEAYNHFRSSANRFLRNDLVTQVAHDLGTASVVDYSDYLGIMPKKYYSQGIFNGSENISGSIISETILVGNSACHGCVIACGRVVDLGDGKHRKGPEYETLVSFGPNLLNKDVNSIVHLNELCDLHGLDTISTGNVIGLAYKMYEDGTISKADTGGLELVWGNTSSAKELIHLIARRVGIGDIMADGARKFAKTFGVEEEAIQVNGLEVPYHDPRGASGMALVYATSPRGACHNKSDYFFVDWGQADETIGIEYFSRQDGAEKAANVARHQDYRTVFDALVLCLFSNIPIETIKDLVNTALGVEFSKDDLILTGERAWNLKRCINIRMGLNKGNDKLPQAFLKPLSDGGSAGYTIPFDEMLDAYYSARDWDKLTGIPTRKKLEELGLKVPVKEFYINNPDE